MKTYGFTFNDTRRLANVKRWGIIDMSRQQSVAEHSFNVAMISLMLVNRVNEVMGRTFIKDVGPVLAWALHHDMPEILTGDIPTPIKSDDFFRDALNAVERERFPLYTELKEKVRFNHEHAMAIVKIADYVDAIRFATDYCVDQNKSVIVGEMVRKMRRLEKDLVNSLSFHKASLDLDTQLVEAAWTCEKTA